MNAWRKIWNRHHQLLTTDSESRYIHKMGYSVKDLVISRIRYQNLVTGGAVYECNSSSLEIQNLILISCILAFIVVLLQRNGGYIHIKERKK